MSPALAGIPPDQAKKHTLRMFRKGAEAMELLDRRKMKLWPLGERPNKVVIPRDLVPLDAKVRPFTSTGQAIMDETITRLVQARSQGKARMLTFGAHAIKNGLTSVLIALIESGWITHLATNGAGVIHDWELAFQGETSEDVKANVTRGMFGSWEETGQFINLALLVGAYEGLGYGESIGKLVATNSLLIPTEEELTKDIAAWLEYGQRDDTQFAPAAADLLWAVRNFNLQPGQIDVKHAFQKYGLQAAAYKLKVPFTGHPMFGHDIIYCHPQNYGAAIGRAAERDFLSFAHSVSQLDGGVYVSLGSAVMSPMIFEKSLNMSQNLAIQDGKHIDNHLMVVVDLQESHWDWFKGEPPQDNPDYYLRYCKSFSRMGGKMHYLTADNRDFLLALWQGLQAKAA